MCGISEEITSRVEGALVGHLPLLMNIKWVFAFIVSSITILFQVKNLLSHCL